MEESPDFSKDLAAKKKSLSERVAKSTLKKPGEVDEEKSEETSGSGLKLKKPSGQGFSKKLRPPGPSQLKKPGDSNEPERQQVNNPERTSTKLSLRKPGDLDSPETSEGRSSQELKKPAGSDSSASAVNEPVLQLKNQTKNDSQSRLSAPGSLSLKKSEPFQDNDSSTGLRLRQPSDSPSLEEQLKDQDSGHGHEHKNESNDKELPKDSNISLKLQKQDEKDSKEKSAPNLIPPGLEIPEGKDDQEESKTEEKKKDRSVLSSEDSDKDATVTRAAEKLDFARKRKTGMSAKQKKQITFVWIPILIVFAVLGFLFVSKLLFPIPTQDDPQATESAPGVKSGKDKKKSKVKEKKKGSAASKKTKKKSKGIQFPDELLVELEQEYGTEAKDQFLEEWKILSNKDRKKYLVEIDAWKEEYEVKLDKKESPNEP